MNNDDSLILLLAIVLVLLLVSIVIVQLLRRGIREQLSAQAMQQALAELQRQQHEGNERLERELRLEMQQGVVGQVNAARIETQQTLSSNLAQMQGSVQQALHGLQTQMSMQLNDISESNARRLHEMREALDAQLARMRETLNQQLQLLQQQNAAKLEEMRRTVDEKLQATLETRLGESFRQVAERLEQVHKGLGEMQTLAAGVGDLKHLLTNVKTRGLFGEAQLGSLLEQVFTADQYAAQVQVRPGAGREAVDFAIRMPGQGQGTPVWLPIDAKFPTEDFERLLEAQERADAEGVQLASRALEQRLRQEAKSIASKYIEPPYTTDFAILFLPTESLFAEALRRPGLLEALRRDHKVVLAGPTTLLAMLSSLQMGFRSLAVEKRSHEILAMLGAVKTEFSRFGDMLEKARQQTASVLKTLETSGTRTRAMERALRNVQALPEAQSQALLAHALAQDDEADASTRSAS